MLSSFARQLSESGYQGVREEAVLYWHKYLWHHKEPRTRLLHKIGSWICILGFTASMCGLGWFLTPVAIAIGYGFAFAGHYVVEKNRPLTLNHPVRAAVCNWVMFFYEMFFDVELKLTELSALDLNVEDLESF